MELVEYIGDLTKEGLPPTRQMIQNFASEVAQEALRVMGYKLHQEKSQFSHYQIEC
jgi:hypothetical protein